MVQGSPSSQSISGPSQPPSSLQIPASTQGSFSAVHAPSVLMALATHSPLSGTQIPSVQSNSSLQGRPLLCLRQKHRCSRLAGEEPFTAVVRVQLLAICVTDAFAGFSGGSCTHHQVADVVVCAAQAVIAGVTDSDRVVACSCFRDRGRLCRGLRRRSHASRRCIRRRCRCRHRAERSIVAGRAVEACPIISALPL